jgi:hypothetical protein
MREQIQCQNSMSLDLWHTENSILCEMVNDCCCEALHPGACMILTSVHLTSREEHNTSFAI